MDKTIIKKIILENQQRIAALEIHPRSISVEKQANYIFTGQRRAGKTWFVFGLLQEMLKMGQSIETFLTINFEDERLIGFNHMDFDTILECYYELFPHRPVLFFDEIQNITGWQKFARRMADEGYRTYITGSNSQMLSSEMASTLGGRYLVQEIGTLSFPEFLYFHGITVDEHFEFSPSRFEIIRLFGQYFTFGGFPELFKFTDKKEYLSNLFQKVFLGDIIARYQVRNAYALRLLVKKLAESTMDEVSFNRMRNIIQSTGNQIGTATVIEYAGYLEDSFLMRSHSNYEAKISSRKTMKKYYFNDLGILSLFLSDPASFQLETLVFNHLKRTHGANVFYLRNGFEVDFYIPSAVLIQVAYRLDEPSTRIREISALMKAAAKYAVKKLVIVTYESEEKIVQDGIEIQVIPAWKWLLQKS